MPIPSSYIVLIRMASLVFILLAATLLDVNAFAYRSLFVGLLFPHFLLGFYYSRRNVQVLREKKYALAIGSGVLLVGLYFSMQQLQFAPYFLVVHAALSDAYLLPLGTRIKDSERMKMLKTAFYIICFSLLFLPLSTASVAGLGVLSVLGALALGAIIFYSTDLLKVCIFELPLVAFVLYAKTYQLTFDVHHLGFYHITTWYAFSLWMLLVKEKDFKKAGLFFSKIGVLAVLFVLLFERGMGLAIVDVSFAKVIGFWSILHITSSIPLSKFNPRILKRLFYA